jgi:putative nucleotidyltransferase with HDIG domain
MEPTHLNKVLNRINDLPTLPNILIKLTELINDSRTSARDLEKVISIDQTQTARVLKLVNSALYGFPRKISSVREAVTILGFNAIKNLCLTVSIFDLFSNAQEVGLFDRKRFWQHSLGCAVGAKVIGRHIGYPEREELFVAGLLHDIGKVVLDQFFPEEFNRIISQAKENNTLMVEVEKNVLDFTHAQIGQILADRWRLPFKLQDSIAFHHMPQANQRSDKEVAVIHLADILCRAKDLGWGGDNRIPLVDKKAWDTLKLKLTSLELIMEEMEAEYSGVAAILVN